MVPSSHPDRHAVVTENTEGTYSFVCVRVVSMVIYAFSVQLLVPGVRG